jgi:putative SOS response-associated peptidase YedK
MCGRFTLTANAKELAEEFQVSTSFELEFESYNVAPSQALPIIHLDEYQNRKASLMEWGFLPSWAKESKGLLRPINARLETVHASPMFKSSLQKRRGLIPASGFYEWNSQAKPKQPLYFYKENHTLFGFAGIWNIWEQEVGIILSFAIITKEAEEPVKPIHGRMPVVLNQEHYESWLNKALLPEASPPLTCHPVSLAVNSPKNNGVELIANVNS